MTPGQLRRLYTYLMARLILEMIRRGFAPALDAQDVRLYRCRHRPAHDSLGCPDPDYIADAESQRPFGAFWVAQHPLCRWSPVDGNHYGLLDYEVVVA